MARVKKPVTATDTQVGTTNIPSPSSPEDRPLGPLSLLIPPTTDPSRDVVKVNNASISELKNACDDGVKRFLSRPDLFKQIHLHTDVRLALGWLSVFVAAGTALYGYKTDFETSKPVVIAGLALYIALTSLQTLYAYFIEGNTVFVGKRKTFSKRIITERITLSSTTIPISSSSSSSTLPKPFSSSSSASSAASSTTSLPPPPPKSSSSLSPSSASSSTPSYELSISYVQSTSGGKSLIRKGKTREVQGYNAFFDEQGVLDQERFEKWVGELVEQAMDGKST